MEKILFTKSAGLRKFWQEHNLENALFVDSLDQALANIKAKSIVCIDINAIRNDTKGTINSIIQEFSDVKILVLSSNPNFLEGKELLTLGIKGYANSYMQQVHFNDALESIENGNVWLYPEFIQSMIGELSNVNSSPINLENDKFSELSTREKEIADLIYKGLSNKEISEQTGITPRTVKAHSKSIYTKLDVKDKVSLVLFMQRQKG